MIMDAINKLLLAASEFTGFSTDKISFLFCMLLCVPLGLVFRLVLHPSKVSPTTRRVTGLVWGVALVVFCFGWESLILFGLSVVYYILTAVVNPTVVHRYVFIAAMGTLSVAHLYRQITNYGVHAVDFSGPLMLIVQRVIYIAYNLHDGFVTDENKLTDEQKREKLKKVPSLLEYFSYIFHYSMILAGPLCTFKEFNDFIDGSDIRPKRPGEKEPSPLVDVIRKLSSGFLCVFILFFTEDDYPIPRNAAEAVNNLAGLGFNGFDENGKAKWDRITNINILKFEFATNIKMVCDNWNISTALWLRRTVYERCSRHRTLAVFITSSVWHGFYPGYYMMFLSLALFIEAARMGRRVFRPYFQKSYSMALTYDVITCIVTVLSVAEGGVPFQLLQLRMSLDYWRSLYFYAHIWSVLLILFCRMRGTRPRPTEKPQKDEPTLEMNKNWIDKLEHKGGSAEVNYAKRVKLN
ncbi:lysophospholipid acyltransferase 6-like isoform X2 [Porites lutea]|uniref:lysophospholipid acyltransferase 6-like isoform X2 n=1 Tax=Porites lutea TaxID=51062 RepID=UPI003CC55FCE